MMTRANESIPPSEPPAIRCLNCSYSLHGLESNRCPECGRHFDPNDPTTYAAFHADGCRSLLLSLLAAALVASPILFLLLGYMISLTKMIRPIGNFTLTAILVAIGLVVCSAGWLLSLEFSRETWRALRNPIVRVKQRRLAWLAFLISTFAYSFPPLLLAIALLGAFQFGITH